MDEPELLENAGGSKWGLRMKGWGAALKGAAAATSASYQKNAAKVRSFFPSLLIKLPL